jgi:hypothetical protein
LFLLLVFLQGLENDLRNNQSVSANFSISSTSSGFLGDSLVLLFLPKSENKDGLYAEVYAL